jgi:hypothetical protein
MIHQNTLTQRQINALLDSAETKEHVSYNQGSSGELTEITVTYVFKNIDDQSRSLTIDGRGRFMGSPDDFDLEKGRKYAREEAFYQLQSLKGCLVQSLSDRLTTAPQKFHQNNNNMTTQNTVTQEQIDALLNSAETEECIFWGKEIVVSYKLPSGFTVLGRAACVDPANFDPEIGRDMARKDVASQLWKLEGYVLQLRLAGLVKLT